MVGVSERAGLSAPGFLAAFVFEGVFEVAGEGGVGEAFDEVEGEVEAGGDAAGGDEVAGVYDAGGDDLDAGGAEVFEGVVMGDGGAVLEEAGGGEEHRAGADGSDEGAGGVELREGGGEVAAGDFGAGAGGLAADPATAGDNDDIGAAGAGGGTEAGGDVDTEAMVGDDFARGAEGGDFDLPAGLAGGGHAEDFKGGDHVEFVKTVEGEDLPEHGGMPVKTGVPK